MLKTDADNDNSYNGFNWAFFIKNSLQSLGLYEIWINQDICVPNINLIKQRIYDNFLQSWNSSVNESQKLCTFNLFKNEISFEKYLDVIKETSLSNILSRFRLSSHSLCIETGRYKNVPKNMRLCKCCNMKVVENEYHFLLVCPLYADIRKRYFANYFCHWPNMFKFKSLIKSQNCKTLYNLSKYIKNAMKLRADVADNL